MVGITKDNIKVGLLIHRVDSNWKTTGASAIIIAINSISFNVRWQDTGSLSCNWDFLIPSDMRWVCEFEDKPVNKTIVTIIETPCRICTKMNDIGITICWSCGNQP